MRIEYVTSVRLHEVSAPSHHVLGVCRAFRRAGYDVALICPAPGIPAEYPVAQTAHVIQFPFYEGKVGWRLFHGLLAARLRAAALTGRLADLYYFRLTPCLLASAAMKSLRRPKALELNGLEYLGWPGASNMLRECDFIMVGSDEMKRAVHQAFPTLPGKVMVQSNIGIDAVRVNAIEWSAARAETGLPRSAFVALILSGFCPYHDFETAWAALAAVAGRRPVILVIAGSGEQLTAVKAASLRWANRLDVRFLGPIRGRCLSLYASAADVCINLISRERLSAEGNGKGQKTIDYLAHGRPVIESITDRLPVPEWVRNYTFPVTAEDSQAVEDALVWIMEHRDEANVIAAAGRDYVMAKFTWSRVTDDFLSRLRPGQPDTFA